MTKFSQEMKKQGKVNTQVAIKILYDDFSFCVWGREGLDLAKRMKAEIPCEKNGEGRGAFYYFKIKDVKKFGRKVLQERMDYKKTHGHGLKDYD